MERLVGKFCIVKYNNRISLYETFTLLDLNFYKEKVRKFNLSVEIEYDKNLDFYRLILTEWLKCN